MKRMTKSRKPESSSVQKAPKTDLPMAPFGRQNRSSPATSQTQTGPPKPGLEKAGIRSGESPRKGRSNPQPTRTQGEHAKPFGSAAGALISRRAADRLRNGHVWVYASDVESIQVLAGSAAPSLLPVADSRGLLLGTALYSPTSQIALRLVSRNLIDETAWLELLKARLRKAIALRQHWLNEQNDSCRLCFSEADELPGLIVDKYGKLVILQLLAKSLYRDPVREACVSVLRELLEPAAILERPDPRVRELEGLSAPRSEPLWVKTGANAEELTGKTRFRLNELHFVYDANAGQKTGAFLDQRDNYAAVQRWAAVLNATDRALDVCCYQGGFALHLGQVCKRVTGIDTSRASLEVAEQNLQANRDRIGAEVDWIEGDAFRILRDWSEAGEIYDTIVLDPPAFAKTRRAVEGALRGYKELNLRALKMLRPGGLLVTCSCSHHVGWAELEGAVASAAIDSGRRVRLLERRGASLDHPVVMNLPETEYLKCLVLEVE